MYCLHSSVYDVSGAASDRNCVVLNDIHIDIMDYIVPATCTDTEFRQMWAEFEWENKVAVNTNIKDLHEYMDHLIGTTNMKCLTPEKVGRPVMRLDEDGKRLRGHDEESRRLIEEHTEKLKVCVGGGGTRTWRRAVIEEGLVAFLSVSERVMHFGFISLGFPENCALNLK